MGRERPTAGHRVIRTLSRLGILVGTVETAALPALLAPLLVARLIVRLTGARLRRLAHLGNATLRA